MTERPAGRIPDATLANPRAERIKRIAALAGRSARSKSGLFLVEGPQGVREAVLHAADRVEDVYLTPDAAARYGEILAAAQSHQVYVHIGTPEVLEAISPDSQGVLAVLRTSGISLDNALGDSPRLVAVLSNVRDPGNAGTVIRAADAAGADAVVIVGESVDLTNPKVVRASAGSIFHLPVARGGSLADTVEALHARGVAVVAADGEGTPSLVPTELDPADPRLAEPTAWVFGNEAWGLSEEELALTDRVVRIPIYGKAESLNLATASAVCLYASAAAQNG